MSNDTHLVGNIVKTECQHFFVNNVIMIILTIFLIKIHILSLL